MYVKFFKPILDFIAALLAIILLLPLFIIIGIIIKLQTGDNPFFIQERLGLNGKIFKIIKFRSMTSEYKTNNGVNTLSEDDHRITKIGKFIRKTSIDELPQIVNIFKGQMSFIGPRPPLVHYPKYYKDYTDFERKRFLVKPGISGLAQIRCREIHDWNINIPIDVEYYENISFINDMKLFLKSISVFFKTDNIYTK